MIRIYARSVPPPPHTHRGTQALDDDAIGWQWQDWSHCAHSILTKMQTKMYPLLFTFSVEFLSVEYVNNKLLLNHVAPSVEMMMHMRAIW